jgi:hypothetical protein
MPKKPRGFKVFDKLMSGARAPATASGRRQWWSWDAR